MSTYVVPLEAGAVRARRGVSLGRVAWLGILLAGFAFPHGLQARNALTLIGPSTRIVFQRDLSNQAEVPVSGLCPAAAERVEVRLVPRRANEGQATGWNALAMTPGRGRFSGAIKGQGGWYNLEARACAGDSILATATVERVGVGDVFVVVGHSVAAGQDINMPGADDDRVNTVALDKESDAFKAYLRTADPMHLPEPAFAHYGAGVIPAPFGSGNYFWSRFGEEVARKQNVPVLIYNAAFGGTSLEHWAKSARRESFEHSFVKAEIGMPYINLANTLRRYIPFTGLRAILADQGQNDWPVKDEQVVAANYQTWIAQARLDLGYPQLAIVVNRQTPFLRDTQIRAAQEQVLRSPHCFPGPDYDTLTPDDRPDGIHLSAAGQGKAAMLWADALSSGFFQTAQPWTVPVPAAATPGPNDSEGRMRPARLQSVTINDAFWSPKLKVYRERTIPHSWFYMQWELRALRKAAGQAVEGDLNGTWGEANLYKFLETVAYALAMQRDPVLEERVDEIVDLLAAGQQRNGYSHIYIINSKKLPWDPGFLDGSHDGYVLGHMIEAAIEYHAATGKTRFLDVARRAADEAYEHFLGPNGQPGFCGHAELEMALVELYRVTHEPRYLALSKAFVEWRGRNKVKPFSETPRAYFQDHVPVREQGTLDGHAVRALFFATGVADLALETGDGDYRLAAGRFWDSTAHRRMTITGSVGPRHEHEAFGEDYELPNNGYYESCAACGLADFAHRVFQLERQGEAMDVLERVLYNAVLHGMELTGTNSYYQNPLSDHDRPRYNSWVCCPPNLSRTLLQVGRYAYAQSESELYVNLFVNGAWQANLPSGPVKLDVATAYPWDGRVRVTVQVEKPAHFTLAIRRPGWCRQVSVRLNGQEAAAVAELERGYFRLERTWTTGDVVDLDLAMPVERMVAHPNIRDCQGKVALQRGPIVYGFEGLDNGGSAQVTFDDDPRLEAKLRSDFLGGVTVIAGVSAARKPVLAIPFYALANRGKSSQEVWAAQPELVLGDSWWLGRLYRPMAEVRVAPNKGAAKP